MTAPAGRLRVERWSRQSIIRTGLIGLILASLFTVPTVFDPNVTGWSAGRA